MLVWLGHAQSIYFNLHYRVDLTACDICGWVQSRHHNHKLSHFLTFTQAEHSSIYSYQHFSPTIPTTHHDNRCSSDNRWISPANHTNYRPTDRIALPTAHHPEWVSESSNIHPDFVSSAFSHRYPKTDKYPQSKSNAKHTHSNPDIYP